MILFIVYFFDVNVYISFIKIQMTSISLSNTAATVSNIQIDFDQEAFIPRIAVASNAMLPQSATYSLGSSSKPWNTLYASSISSGDVSLYKTTNVEIGLSNNKGANSTISIPYNANQYSTSAQSNDLVIRNTTRSIHLQSGTGGAAMTIDSNNNIGIGTTIPSNKFSVVGNSKLTGDVVIDSNLSVTGTTTVAGLNAAATSVTTLGASGATTLAGLTAGATSVTTLGASGATSLSNTLNVSGASTLSNTLRVTGATTLAGLTAGATTVTTLGASGATTLAGMSNTGTMTVTGATTLAGLTAGATSVTTLEASGATSLSNTLDVSGATTLSNTFNVSGITSLSNRLNVWGPTTLSNTLNVTGATTLRTTLGVTGTSTLSGVSVTTFGASGATTLAGMSNTGTMSVTGATTLAGLTAGATTVTTLGASGATTLAGMSNTGTMSVTGATTLAGLTAGATSVTTLGASGSTTLAGTSVTTLSASGATTLAGSSNTGTMSVLGATTLSNTLDVLGTTSVSTLIASGTSTFNNHVVTANSVQIKSGTDSAGAPGYTWSGDTSTGMYRTGTSIGLAIGGVNRATLNQAGDLTITNNITASGNATLSGNAHYLGKTTGSTSLTLYDVTDASWKLSTAGNSLNFQNNNGGPFTNKMSVSKDGLLVLNGTSFSNTGTMSVLGATTLSNNLTVLGTTTLAGTSVTTLAASGATTLAGLSNTGTMSVNGATTLAGMSNTGTMSVTGAATLLNTLGVTGKVNINDQVCASTDTVSAPSYSWTSGSSNMGMYRSSANVIGFSTNGVERLLIGNSTITTSNILNTYGTINVSATNALAASFVGYQGVGIGSVVKATPSNFGFNQTSQYIVNGIYRADVTSNHSLGWNMFVANNEASNVFNVKASGDVNCTGIISSTGLSNTGTMSVTGAATLLNTLGVTGKVNINDQVCASTDTVSAPSYSWTSGSSNMGMYRSSANVIGFSTNGVERLLIGNSTITTSNILNTYGQINVSTSNNAAAAATFTSFHNAGLSSVIQASPGNSNVNITSQYSVLGIYRADVTSNHSSNWNMFVANNEASNVFNVKASGDVNCTGMITTADGVTVSNGAINILEMSNSLTGYQVNMSNAGIGGASSKGINVIMGNSAYPARDEGILVIGNSNGTQQLKATYPYNGMIRSHITNANWNAFAATMGSSNTVIFEVEGDPTNNRSTTTINASNIVNSQTVLWGSTGVNVKTPLAGLHVSSNARFDQTMTIIGASTLSNTLNVSGATTLSNTLRVTGTTTLSGFLIANTAGSNIMSTTNINHNTSNYNVANSIFQVMAATVTNRSINASGTINTGGTDYAEYLTKCTDCPTFNKGDIVGFAHQGMITASFSNAISFGIKSTNPSFVGGDHWGSSIGPEPSKPETTLSEDGTVVLPTEEQWASYSNDMMTWNNNYEAIRATVDRICFCGQVPLNIYGALNGDYIVPFENPSNGLIMASNVSPSLIDFEMYRRSVGMVNKILSDGRAQVICKMI